jgi:hypothetical protein
MININALKQNRKGYFHIHLGEKMGNQNTGTGSQTLSDNDIRLLSQRSQLPPHILQQLYEAFLERAGRNGR